MWREMINLWQSVRDPEYAHLLLESLPLYGLAASLIFLAVSFFTREAKSRLLALTLIAVCSGSVWPYVALREKAQPRIVATHDPSYGPLIREQTKRRTSTGWAYYSLAMISTITLILVAAGKGRGFVALTTVAAVGCFWLSLWLHKKECEIYHRNIVKYRPP